MMDYDNLDFYQQRSELIATIVISLSMWLNLLNNNCRKLWDDEIIVLLVP